VFLTNLRIDERQVSSMRKLMSADFAGRCFLMLSMHNYVLLVWRLNWTHLTKPLLRS